jgi:hypothetical protein
LHSRENPPPITGNYGYLLHSEIEMNAAAAATDRENENSGVADYFTQGHEKT